MSRVSRQRVFTIVTDIRPGGDAAIEETLRLDPFDFGCFDMLHFACFVIFPASKLALPKSKLVLECNIDGSADVFLEQLARSPRLRDIYSHCECFDATNPREYLREHMKWPQLFHVGAPYRSVQSIKDDERICDEYANRVKNVATRELGSAIHRSPSGVAEWWNWEAIKPWVALGLFLLAVLAIVDWWLSLGRIAYQRFHLFDRLVLFGFHLLVFAAATLTAPKLWLTSRPELRRPVTLPGLIVFAAVLGELRLASMHQWSLHQWSARSIAAAVGLIVLVVGLVAWLIREQRARWRNVRLAATRTAETGSSPMTPFADLPIEGDRLSPRPGVREALNRWWPWLALFFIAWVIFLVALPHPNILIIGLTVLGFLEAIWIATLCGWPAGRWTHWHPSVIAYIGLVTIASFLLIKVQLLTWGNSEGVKTFLLVGVTVGGFLGVWQRSLPAPPAEPNEISREDLARLLDQEDRYVQNHMAAVVPLPPHWFRTGSIKFFLWILNVFFFRSWLPDLFRGKLFGVPTVHFCQWVLIDDRNYLFFSNYDHSWSAYLDDFGATIANGLQKIWGQGVNNPGFDDVEAFKRYARSTMVTHAQWYPAYRGLSLRQIWNNEQIRRRAAAAGSEEQTLTVLRRCSAAPKTLPDFFHARIR